MQGKFNLSYFLRGAGLEDWFKSWGLGFRLIVTIVAIIFVGVTIYRAFFMKTQTQTQRLNIYPFSFSTVTYAPQQSQKQEIKKRSWWLPSLFGEIYGFAETTGADSRRTGLGARGGLRWEW